MKSYLLVAKIIRLICIGTCAKMLSVALPSSYGFMKKHKPRLTEYT